MFDMICMIKFNDVVCWQFCIYITIFDDDDDGGGGIIKHVYIVHRVQYGIECDISNHLCSMRSKQLPSNKPYVILFVRCFSTHLTRNRQKSNQKNLQIQTEFA